MQVRKQQLELDMEQQTGSKQEKEYIKAVYCHPADLTYMQSTSCNCIFSVFIIGATSEDFVRDLKEDPWYVFYLPIVRVNRSQHH